MSKFYNFYVKGVSLFVFFALLCLYSVGAAQTDKGQPSSSVAAVSANGAQNAAGTGESAAGGAATNPEVNQSSESSESAESANPANPAEAKPIVWFVHGMVSIRDNFDKELEVLAQIYPNAEKVEMKGWNSPKMSIVQMGVAWSVSLENSTKFVPELAEMILQLPPDQRDRLILAGHSLGARIVVKAAAVCAKKNVHVKKIILAGAAIDNDDPDIQTAIGVSNEIVDNLINFNDALLALYKIGAESNSALGTGYLYKTDPQRFREIGMEGTVEHYGYKYFQRYLKAVKDNNFAYPGIIVPQDYSNVNFPTGGGMVWWDALDSCEGWRLQHNQATGHCRIIDPDGSRLAWGRKVKMEAAFDKVKFQLAQKSGKPFVIDSSKIEVNQDLLNADRTTGGGQYWWNDKEEFHGWKLQQNKVSGHFRILDDSNVRRAWGWEDSMRKSFTDVKRQINLQIDEARKAKEAANAAPNSTDATNPTNTTNTTNSTNTTNTTNSTK